MDESIYISTAQCDVLLKYCVVTGLQVVYSEPVLKIRKKLCKN